MTRPTLRLAAAALLVLPILARGEAMAPDPAAAFTDMIAASRMVMTVRNGRADGPGARYLAEKATQSSFFLIGEEHGVATIADTIRALVPILHEAGYRRLAVEADPYTARVVEDRLREGGPDALAKYLHQDGYAIAMPFFGWASEAALANAFLAGTSSGPQGTLWGLDQVFIGAYGPLLERIGKQASSPAARELATALAAQARGNMDFLAKVEQSQFDTLRAQLALAGDTELVSMVDEMILSSRIYAPFIGRAGWSVYVANDTRENLMKQNFLSRYRAANQSKVLFKFGSNHMVRGLSPTHVASLGNFVADFARSQGTEAFNLLVLCGPGTQAGDFHGNLATCDIDVTQAMPEVAAALDPAQPTLFDLALWKNDPQRWKHLPEDIRALLWAYDAIMVVPNGKPARAL